ncbi:MAG TPA: hypothetical protein V6C76_10820 [Drouetiella sp.]
MSLLGRIAAFFPLLHVVSIMATTWALIAKPGISTAILLLFTVYLLPPCLLRLYCLRYPLKSGRWNISQPGRCDWWIAHQLQMVYAAVPALEALLRFVPGLYSAWLRLWGSKVGKRVYWTALVEIIDRHMMRVGDDVTFGHKVICTSHVVSRKNSGEMMLILRPVRIGSGSFIGALSRLGPGVKVPAQSAVPYNTEHKFNYAE